MKTLKNRILNKLKTAKNYIQSQFTNLGNSGAYFLYDETLKKVVVVLYFKLPETPYYMVGIFGHKYDAEYTLTSSELYEGYKTYVKSSLHYNMYDYTPTQLHDEFHKQKKLSRIYSVKWFQTKYDFVEHQLKLAGVRV